MKHRNRVKKLEARIKGYEAIQAKQTGTSNAFHKPGSLRK